MNSISVFGFTLFPKSLGKTIGQQRHKKKSFRSFGNVRYVFAMADVRTFAMCGGVLVRSCPFLFKTLAHRRQHGMLTTMCECFQQAFDKKR